MNELYANLYDFLSILNTNGFELIDGRYLSQLSDLDFPNNYVKFYLNRPVTIGQKHNVSSYDEAEDMYDIRYDDIYRCFIELDFMGDPELTTEFQQKVMTAMNNPVFTLDYLNLFVIEGVTGQRDLEIEINNNRVNLNKLTLSARFELDFGYEVTTIETVDYEVDYE